MKTPPPPPPPQLSWGPHKHCSLEYTTDSQWMHLNFSEGQPLEDLASSSWQWRSSWNISKGLWLERRLEHRWWIESVATLPWSFFAGLLLSSCTVNLPSSNTIAFADLAVGLIQSMQHMTVEGSHISMDMCLTKRCGRMIAAEHSVRWPADCFRNR